MFAHLVVDLLIAQISLDPQAGCGELFGDRFGIAVRIRHDGRDDRLHRCQPHREAPGIVFNQDADEPLIRPEDRAVEHDGTVLFAILPHIARIKPLGQNAV